MADLPNFTADAMGLILGFTGGFLRNYWRFSKKILPFIFIAGDNGNPVKEIGKWQGAALLLLLLLYYIVVVVGAVNMLISAKNADK
jgi:hypothetical protein